MHNPALDLDLTRLPGFCISILMHLLYSRVSFSRILLECLAVKLSGKRAATPWFASRLPATPFAKGMTSHPIKVSERFSELALIFTSG